MTSPSTSGRLQNAIKYCTKVRRMGPAGQRVEKLCHSLTQNHQILTDIHAHIVYSHIGYIRLYHTIAGMTKVCPYAKYCENKRAHQLLGCAHFVHFAICPRTLWCFCTKCYAVSKASSNFSSEEYRQRLLRLKRRGVSPSHTLRWASCSQLQRFLLPELG